jgi:hypothetical protein
VSEITVRIPAEAIEREVLRALVGDMPQPTLPEIVP